MCAGDPLQTIIFAAIIALLVVCVGVFLGLKNKNIKKYLVKYIVAGIGTFLFILFIMSYAKC